MLGTLLNIAAVLVGGVLGLLFGSRLPVRVRQTVIAGLGLFTGALGLQMFLKTENAIIVLGSLLAGGLLGEWWKIEDGLRGLGGWLEMRFIPRKAGESQPDLAVTNRSRFIQGFLTASLVFCVCLS